MAEDLFPRDPLLGPQLPGPKTPEQLARDLEAHVIDQELRARRWRARHRRYVVIALATGALIPFSVTWVLGGLWTGGRLGPACGLGLLGLLCAAVVVWRGWGIPLCVLWFGAVFTAYNFLFAAWLPEWLVPAIRDGSPFLLGYPMMLGMMVVAGGLVAHVVQLDEDG